MVSCPNCGIKRNLKHPKRAIKNIRFCRSCSFKKAKKRDYKGLPDFIEVEHEAGNRKIQKVKKFKGKCSVCNKDKGFVFKKFINSPCSSCSKKQSYAKGSKINDNKSTIRSYHKTPLQGEVCVRSSYEAFYIEYLNSKDTPYLYEAKKFVFSDGSSYLPDFYLIKEDTYIEVKGLETAAYKQKMSLLKKEYPQIKINVLHLNDLKSLGFSPHELKNQFRITVKGDAWMCNVLPASEFNALFGENNTGMTVIPDRRIYFKTDEIRWDTIAHEIYHCYFSYINTGSANLAQEDVEELNAEFISKDLMKMMYHTMIVYRQCQKILEKRYGIALSIDPFDANLTPDQLDKLFKGFKFFSKTWHTNYDL